MNILRLGHIYLEAYRVFREDEWNRRAEWITGTLIHAAFEGADGSIYWLDWRDTVPYAWIVHELMVAAIVGVGVPAI